MKYHVFFPCDCCRLGGSTHPVTRDSLSEALEAARASGRSKYDRSLRVCLVSKTRVIELARVLTAGSVVFLRCKAHTDCLKDESLAQACFEKSAFDEVLRDLDLEVRRGLTRE